MNSEGRREGVREKKEGGELEEGGEGGRIRIRKGE